MSEKLYTPVEARWLLPGDRIWAFDQLVEIDATEKGDVNIVRVHGIRRGYPWSVDFDEGEEVMVQWVRHDQLVYELVRALEGTNGF